MAVGHAPAMALRRSATLYMVVNAAHILSIGLLVGAILPLDLRLAGFFRKVPVEVVAPFLSRSAGVGLVLAIATGFCLFSVRAVEYAENPAFLAKLGLIGLGLLNLLAVHVGRGWKTLTATGRVGPACASPQPCRPYSGSLPYWPGDGSDFFDAETVHRSLIAARGLTHGS